MHYDRCMTGIRWDWLGDHLAVDLANTVRRRGRLMGELLDSPTDLAVWLAHEAHRVPVPEPVDAQVLEEFVLLRDVALRLLQAAIEGKPFSTKDVAVVNEIVRQAPLPHLLSERAGTSAMAIAATGDRQSDLMATLAASIVDLLADPGLHDLGFCDAPSCGQYFHRARPNQQWCCPSCGDRARSARAHRKARS